MCCVLEYTIQQTIFLIYNIVYIRTNLRAYIGSLEVFFFFFNFYRGWELSRNGNLRPYRHILNIMGKFLLLMNISEMSQKLTPCQRCAFENHLKNPLVGPLAPFLSLSLSPSPPFLLNKLKAFSMNIDQFAHPASFTNKK